MAKQIKNFLVYYIHDHKLRRYAEKYMTGRLIDIGCGTKPYKKLLQTYVTEHVGVDHSGTYHDMGNIDLIGTAYEIPAEDDFFDTALCTQVLEHLEEPEKALRECYRVLKPGGYALYSVPFIWHLHEEPRDFYRYTIYGLKYLFEKVGFSIIEIHPLSGFWVTFGQLLVYNIYRFNRGPLRYVPVIPALGVLIQAFAFVLDRVDQSTQWTWAYFAIARKPKH